MKNYTLLFSNTYKKEIEEYKKRRKEKVYWCWAFGIFFMVGMTIITHKISLYHPLEKSGYILILPIVIIAIFVTVFTQVNLLKFFASKKVLEAEAQKFAQVTISQDILLILRDASFVFDTSTEHKFIEKMEQYLWFKHQELNLPGMDFDYTEEHEKILCIKEGCIYYLTSWRYSYGLPFVFTFDKFNRDNKSEEITLQLSPKD